MDKKKLAVIHIVKNELGLSDPKYREILRKVADVKSAKELDAKSFRKLMNYFVRSEHYRINAFGLTIKQKLYIEHLARDLGWNSKHLRNFIHKYYNKYRVEILTKEEAIKLIESLKNVKKHDEKAKV